MSNPNTEFVKVYDFVTRTTTTIPATELSSSMIRIQIQGSDEIVWADGEQLAGAQSQQRHGPFTGARREKVIYIEESLRDVYPMTYVAWEDGFRSDLNVDQEIDIWVCVSRCLNEFIERRHPTPEQRQEAFELLAACMNATPSTVFETFSVSALDRAAAERLVNAFFTAPAN